MRTKPFLIALAAIAAQALIMAPGGANAFLVSAGPADLKFTGVTHQDTPGAVGTESTFGAGYLNEVLVHGSNQVLWAQGTGPNLPNESISFLLYGISDIGVTGTGPFALDNRGCTVGAGCDGMIHIDFYLDHLSASGGFPGTNPAFNTSGGATASDRTGFSTMTGITDGTLLMRWDLVPGADGSVPTATLFQKLDQLTPATNGSGTFLANCVSGPGCATFNSSRVTDSSSQADPNAVANFFGQFTLSAVGANDRGFTNNGWQDLIADPVFTNGVPELSTWAMMIIGFAGVGVQLRRRQRVISVTA